MGGLSGVQQPLVKAVIVVNHEGKRICSRFCDHALLNDHSAQREYEVSLLHKVQSMGELSDSVDVMEFKDSVVAYKQVEDLFMFVVGAGDENELVMAEVLQSLDETLNAFMHGQVFEEAVLEELESLLLIIDELVDQEGIIMETDPSELASRIGEPGESIIDQIPLGDQTLGQALQSARDQITRSILS